MSDRDLLAFQRFIVLWDGDLDQETSVYLLSKWMSFLKDDHIAPHDAPMTCMRCVVDECFRYADSILLVVQNG